MSRCFDADALVTLGSVFEWKLDEALRHLNECESCRVQLRQLATMRDALDEEMEPDRGFVDRVMRDVAREREMETATERRPGLLDVLNPTLAGATAFVALLLAGGGSAPFRPGLAVVIAAAGAALLTLWWNLGRPAAVDGGGKHARPA